MTRRTLGDNAVEHIANFLAKELDASRHRHCSTRQSLPLMPHSRP
ncbi:hypothetical protein [Mycolicibacterium goodii]|nr:hypothetical protein [Mycolicibacterium goodii]